MGRLFWKFFFFIWLAQLSAILATSTTFWLAHRAQDETMAGMMQNPPASPERGSDARSHPPGKLLRPMGLLVPGTPLCRSCRSSQP